MRTADLLVFVHRLLFQCSLLFTSTFRLMLIENLVESLVYQIPLPIFLFSYLVRIGPSRRTCCLTPINTCSIVEIISSISSSISHVVPVILGEN